MDQRALQKLKSKIDTTKMLKEIKAEIKEVKDAQDNRPLFIELNDSKLDEINKQLKKIAKLLEAQAKKK